MSNIIPLHGDPHETTQKLLPWYVTGTLDPVEQRLVEDHLARCAECRAALEAERRLHDAVVAMPPEVPGAWETLRDRAIASTPEAAPVRRSFFAAPGRLTALAASQIAILGLGISIYDLTVRPRQADYHALSAAPEPRAPTGNVIVIFRPDSREQAFRATLEAVSARLVDGPTAAGAYVLAVDPGQRDKMLAKLRAQPDIVLAQPIDAQAVR